jgi:NTE family protein
MPRRALVLGAGGARGFVHMGVLYALERAGLRPDILIGCSIGALIGALYALKGSFAEAERVLREMSKIPLSRDWIEGYLSEYFGNTLIEEMALGFACVSVDIRSPGAGVFPQLAREVVFRRGPLWPAIRASIGTPVIFPVFSYRGMRLVDGGILDPVPAWVAKEMGAERIVSVEVAGTPTIGGLIRKGIFAQWGYRVHRAKRRAMAVSDLYLRITLPYRSLDFNKGEEIAVAGYRAFIRASERFIGRL